LLFSGLMDPLSSPFLNLPDDYFLGERHVPRPSLKLRDPRKVGLLSPPFFFDQGRLFLEVGVFTTSIPASLPYCPSIVTAPLPFSLSFLIARASTSLLDFEIQTKFRGACFFPQLQFQSRKPLAFFFSPFF